MDRMTRNPATLVAGVLVLVGVGFILGVQVGGRRAVEEGHPTPAVPPVRAGAAASRNEPRRGAGSENGAPEEERTRLRERILELETQLRVAHEESVRKPSSEAEAEIARRAFEDLLWMETGEDRNPERLRSLIDHLARITERSASYFITRFRSAPGSDDDGKKIAMQLALMSGGPDAADFVQQLLTDPTLDATLRDRLLSELASRGDGLFSVRRLPVGEALASTAMLMIHSDKLDDRRAGASLLGGVRSSSSRGELIRLLQDSDGNVRESAARSLGMVGDQTTKKILETYAAQTQDAGLRKAAAAAIQEIDGQ